MNKAFGPKNSGLIEPAPFGDKKAELPAPPGVWTDEKKPSSRSPEPWKDMNTLWSVAPRPWEDVGSQEKNDQH